MRRAHSQLSPAPLLDLCCCFFFTKEPSPVSHGISLLVISHFSPNPLKLLSSTKIQCFTAHNLLYLWYAWEFPSFPLLLGHPSVFLGKNWCAGALGYDSGVQAAASRVRRIPCHSPQAATAVAAQPRQRPYYGTVSAAPTGSCLATQHGANGDGWTHNSWTGSGLSTWGVCRRNRGGGNMMFIV